jgi:hypothetical protein
MSSFELPVSKIRVELSYFDICVQRDLLFCWCSAGVRAENVLIESYFRNGFKVNSSWIYSVQNCLEEFNAEFPNVIVDRKFSKTNLSRCVKLFRETGGVYRRKTTGRLLKRAAAVIETGRETMQNAPHTSIRQLVQCNRLNLV